ncbi:protein FAM200A-like [Hydra vulgaris]|uniref:Protein FAM200A-like n=1 Tax=Hydra vulgaris TaxID=6087 RepID=A0ABM4CUF4_HYDVU
MFKNQQINISSSSKESNITTEASFIIAWNIAKSKHPYTDGEFVKQNLFDVILVLDPNNSKIQRLISNISVSRHTTERRISEISVKVEQHLLNDLKNWEAFSLALDESTDIQDKPLMAVFEALDTVLVKANAKNKLVIVATDGATAMVGKHIRLMVQEIVNYIWSNAKNHRQFKNFISELGLADKPSDLSFYCAVRWLSSSDVLYRFVELLEPIKCFLFEKQKTFEIFDYVNFLQDLLFLIDVVQRLQNLICRFSYGCPIPENILEETSQFEMELLDLQEDQNIHILHKIITLLDFWKMVPEVKYPQLKRISIKLISIFGST